MAGVFFESFEDISSWQLEFGQAPTTIIGRTGNAVHFNPLVDQCRRIYRLVPSAYHHATWTCGFAFIINSALDSRPAPILQFMADAADTVHASLLIDNLGRLQAQHGQPPYSPVYGTSSLSLSINTWHYIEMQVTLHSTTGKVIVKVDGTNWINLTNINTFAGGGAMLFDAVGIGYDSTYSDTVCTYDDFYVINGAGTVNNDFLGDLTVETIYPDGMSVTGWTGSDGNQVDNHLLVNEIGTPSMTGYVRSTTVGQQDLYTYQSLASTGGSIKGITNVTYAQKSDTTGRGLKLLIKDPSSTVNKSADNALSQTPSSYSYTIDRKNSGTEYTIAEVNAIVAGIEVGS